VINSQALEEAFALAELYT